VENLEEPRVSIIMASYNHEPYVREAVESVLGQTIDNVELVVVDDGSTDGTEEVLRGIDDPRLRLVFQENHGPHHAMNRAVGVARGEWLAFLNSDDRYLPDKLERHLSLHRDNPRLEASASRVSYISDDGDLLPDDHFVAAWYAWARSIENRSASLFQALLVTNPLVTLSSLFMSKRVFEELGGIAPLRTCHDWLLFLRLAHRGRFTIIEAPLMDYRVHSRNTIKEDPVLSEIEGHVVAAWALLHLVPDDPSWETVCSDLDAMTPAGKDHWFIVLAIAGFLAKHGGKIDRIAALLRDTEHPVTTWLRGRVRELHEARDGRT
jgi:glycosyltransferase involved in cell wall biosynthesis